MIGMIPSATDELRLREADYSKEKAILLQKIDQLEHSVKDAKEREEAQKKMHETMINCLNSGGDLSSTNQALISLQAAEKQAQAQIEDLQLQRRRLQEALDYKEHKEKELRQQHTDQDQFIKEIQMQIERLQNDKRQMISQQDQERKELQTKINQIQIQKETVIQKVELQNQAQNNEFKVQIETMKLEHQRDLEKYKADYEQSLKEIKYFHEQEKFNLKHRVQRSTNELSSLIDLVKQRDAAQDLDETKQEQIQRKREELEVELQMMHEEVDQIKKHHDSTITQVTKDKVAAETLAKKLQRQLEKIKNAPKPVQIDLSQIMDKTNDQENKQIANLKTEIDSLIKENEKLDEQIKKFRKEKLDSQDYIDTIEVKLRQMQKEKSNQENDSEKCSELKMQINLEKKKNIELQETINLLKDSIETVENNYNSKLLDKDQKMNKLYKDLRDTEKKLHEIQQVFNSGPGFAQQKQHTRNISPLNEQMLQAHYRNISQSPLISHNHAYSQISYHQSPRAQQQNNQSVSITTPMQEGVGINMKQITQVEYTLLKICQRMADNALRMECSACMQIFETSEFYDHINSEHTQQNKNLAQNQSINSYTTNKNNNLTKRFAEDMRSSTHMHNILQTSPRIKEETAQYVPQPNQQQNAPKWPHNSRSFTCLLNEIEEEEKVCNTSKLQDQTTTFSNNGKINFVKQSKSPVNISSEKTTSLANQPKSRNISTSNNMSTLQMSSLGQGNTLQSVLKTQREMKDMKNNTSKLNKPQSVFISTAQRTEIQNLKRENKKLNNKLSRQESKINDVSRDCSFIKKQVQHEKEKANPNSQLTNEIKGLLEKLVTYQANSKGEYGSETLATGSQTSRMNSNLPMSTESLVELKSIQSAHHKKKKSKGSHQHKENKMHQSINMNYEKTNGNNILHQSNKENMKASETQQSTQTLQKAYKHKSQRSQIREEQHNSSSSNDITDSSMIKTERRHHQVKKSEQLCSNSPQRYKNYFEMLSNVADSLNDQKSQDPINSRIKYKQSRYSPTNESQQSKLASFKQQNILCEPHDAISSSRNHNMPMMCTSKQMPQYTVNSSQNNLVLYDSYQTDLFKSKNLIQKKETQAINNNNMMNHIENKSFRRLDFENQNYSQRDSYHDNSGGSQIVQTSCPSLHEYEENHVAKCNYTNYGDGIFASSLDSDPFITGRFCDNNGNSKQFLFKYSANNSKNSTMKFNNHNNQ